jgi:hypothetical protein
MVKLCAAFVALLLELVKLLGLTGLVRLERLVELVGLMEMGFVGLTEFVELMGFVEFIGFTGIVLVGLAELGLVLFERLIFVESELFGVFVEFIELLKGMGLIVGGFIIFAGIGGLMGLVEFEEFDLELTEFALLVVV